MEELIVPLWIQGTRVFWVLNLLSEFDLLYS